MGQTMGRRAEELAEACSLGYLQLAARYDALQEQLGQAMDDRDRLRVIELRLERADVERQLRDLWGLARMDGARWDAWMWDDIRQARRLVDDLAAAVGDSKIPQRVLLPYPALERIARW
ncbi:MAG TPA: hypothetical protein VJX92_18920 [Methylomirabilota bacterium]|nr:hypothetical protein [Methylomirabilota bacterium]